ncbi:YfhO family protein [Paucilactobacillus hokkaidonensis]|uniref:YfhO family protein n=1 Tax=Paucilactobacillus hokkaidonensis TaxID=1193095 RepID=UPI0006CF9213|nr:YfhO family protein [Paucilactobacillus hokkaidonensis]
MFHVFFKNSDNEFEPAGYEDSGTATNSQELLTADQTIPLIYHSAGTMSQQQFNRLDPSQKEAALINNTITKKAKTTSNQTLLNQVIKVPFSYLNGDTVTKKHVSVTMPSTKIDPFITIDSTQKNIKGYELHAHISNISFHSGSLNQRYQNATNNYIQTHSEEMMLSGQDTDLRYSTQLFKLNWLRKNATSISGNTGTFSIQLGYGETTNVFEQMGNDNLSFYDPKASTTLNLGTVKSSENLVSLSLPSSGKYDFDLTLWAVPTGSAVTKAINKNTPAKNIRLQKNSVTADYQAKRSGILATTIPYSTGWHLKGSTSKLPRVNEAFVGIPIKVVITIFNWFTRPHY